MKPLFFFPLLLITHCLFGQLSDDFEDGSFLSNPTWFGDTDRFTVTAGELQLLDEDPTASNTSYLVVEQPVFTDDPTEWRFYARLDFPPSANNLARVYLSAADSDLTQNTEGYFLEIGGSDDNLTLYRQDGDLTSALLAGSAGAVAGTPAVARVLITRTLDGQWEVRADYSGEEDYQLIGTATDNTYDGGPYFGFYCRYTTTRSDKFFFDDLLIRPLVPDTEPPQLLSAGADTPTEIRLTFNEPVDETSATLAANFTIDNGIGNPVAAALAPGDPTQVLLTLGAPLINATTYQVTATNITDANSNTGGPQSVSFTFFNLQPASPGDLLLTEIMADPTPTVGLPNSEYIELYNASDKVLQLSDLRFTSGGAPASLSDYTLPPGQYVTLCSAGDIDSLQALTPLVTVPAGLGLNNGGDNLILTDGSGETILQLAYDDSWYNDPARDDGGYSLELIDPGAPAFCQGNWRAAIDPSGGTPGRTNSVQGLIADQQPPALLTATVSTPSEVILTFDETLGDSAADPGLYQIENGPSILEVLLLGNGGQVLIVLEGELALRTLYTLTVTAGIEDCLGNTVSSDRQITLARGEVANPGDLLLTEIMANPAGAPGLPTAEYLELYNDSEKFLDLKDLRLTVGGSVQVLPPALLLPGEYLTICDENNAAQLSAFGAVVPLGSFPGLTNSGSEVQLAPAGGPSLFQLAYDTRWYADEAKAGGGWSLELIDRGGSLACRHNWRASQNDRGGTPSGRNSVDGQEPEDGVVDLLGVVPVTDTELLLNFNRALEPQPSSDAAAYTIDPDIGINNVAVLLPAADQVRLSLTAPLQPDLRYTLTVASPLADCLGNGVGLQNSRAFGLPEPAEAGDLVINEVLFYPESGGSDFVELYNRSEKVINLKGLEVRNEQKLTGNLSQTVATDYLLLPGQYGVLAPDPADIQARYQTGGPATFLGTDLPTLDNKEGNVTLRFTDLTIDSFDYSDDLHFRLLDDERGVSLERLDPEGPTGSPGNWHSAAATVGFATPGYQNSNFQLTPDLGSTTLSIPERTFSPDGDGFQETLNIFYQVDQPGFILNVNVFDAQGRPVRRLLQNQTLAAEGSFLWDGSTDDGQKARIGIYIIWIELFHPDGRTEQRKETCVLAGQID